jgi:hypothetical protein
MKIEKRKVTNSSKLGDLAKKAVATALGFTATIGLSACDDIAAATTGDNKTQEPDPTCGEVACEQQFSSSSYSDISSSGERLSSEAIEALSSAEQPSSSSSVPYILSGSIAPYEDRSSSSFVETPSSSSFVPPPEAGILPPYEDINDEQNSSSSDATSSSSSEPSSSADIKVIEINPDTLKLDTMIIDTIPKAPFCDPDSSTPGCRVNLCKDPNGCMIFSMVTTFEQDDIQA